MPTLGELKPGARATVAAVEGDDHVVQRLLEMGFVEGTQVEFLRIAPLGDPIEVRIEGRYNLSLRRAEAMLVSVTPA